MIESYKKLQPKPKQFSSLIWFILPQKATENAVKDYTTSDCRHVSAKDGHFEHMMW